MTSKILNTIVITLVKKRPKTEAEFLLITRQAAGSFKCSPPTKASLLTAYHRLVKNKKIKKNPNLENFLIKRRVRTLSGVAVISVLTKPYPCPGDCLFCPTEKEMPKSYLSNEPAVMRAILNDFDPYRQIKMRLQALKNNGHQTDKVELIIMGGTWSYHDTRYQNWFIKRCLEALNNRKAKSIESAQRSNEKAKHRCIGLTLETRPDYINEKEIIKMRNFGCTRVELGIQHIDDQILELNRRDHDTQTSIKAIELLKYAGFKINYHMMLNLPGSTPVKDLAMFKKLYSHKNWMPDMVKIYPCVVVKNSDLHKIWKRGGYKPYSDKQLLNLLIKIKKITPPSVRITRLIRDIPEESIEAGNKTTNLRQLIQNDAKKDGWKCKCIRCREAGHNPSTSPSLPRRGPGGGLKKSILKTQQFFANNGTEYFLSYESKDGKVLYAFLRLRINNRPEESFIPELKNSSIIRELHTYGLMTPIGQSGKVQHQGFGKKLLQEAEKITKKNKLNQIAVISGIGVRGYYKKNGYKLANTYMIKGL